MPQILGVAADRELDQSEDVPRSAIHHSQDTLASHAVRDQVLLADRRDGPPVRRAQQAHLADHFTRAQALADFTQQNRPGLDVEHGVGWVALTEEHVPLAECAPFHVRQKPLNGNPLLRRNRRG